MRVKCAVRAHPRKTPNPNSARFGSHDDPWRVLQSPANVISRRAHRATSPAIAQARGEPIDRQMYPALGELIGLARAIATQQLDLEVIERVKIEEAIANASRVRRAV